MNTSAKRSGSKVSWVRIMILVALAGGLVAQLAMRESGVSRAEFESMEPLLETRIGDRVPEIVFDWGHGEGETLVDALSGDVGCGYVYFFTSSCPACREGADAWSGLATVNGLKMVWVSLLDDRSEVLAFLDAHDVAMPGAAVPEGDGFRRLGVRATPTMWKVQNGIIIDKFVGLLETDPGEHDDATCPMPIGG